MNNSNILKSTALLIALGSSIYSSAQSDVLHYNTPATFFEEALPIGNGNIGAMVYGGIEEEKISLNDITLWTGEPDKEVYSPEAYKSIEPIRKALFSEDYKTADRLQRNVQGHYSQNYQPLGMITLSKANNLSTRQLVNSSTEFRYYRQLDISRAVATVSYDGGIREYFASAPDSVIIVRLKAAEGKTLNERLRYHCQLMHHVTAETQRDTLARMTIDGYAAWSSRPSYAGGKGSFQYDSNRGIHFRTIIQVKPKDGRVRLKNGNELELENVSEALLLITNVTSFNGADKDPVKEGRDYKTLADARISKAMEKTFDQLLQRHVSDYQQYYDRLSIELGTTPDDIKAKTTEQQLRDYTEQKQSNPDLEELYFNYGRYLLISCSRTPGVPANLQGLWNERLLPPWSSNYTSNINVEENYWPSLPAGLGDMHLSLTSFIQKLPVTGRRSAQAYYGVQRGWNLGQNTDIWAMTNPVGERSGDPSWANWPMGGAWISTHLWEHYAYTKDFDFLKEAWPTLRGAADFCIDWLVEHDGYLLTAPGTSPENIYLTPEGYKGRTVYGGFADIAMIRECLDDARKAALLLGEPKSYIDSINKTLTRLLPYRIGKKGNLQEWYHDWEDSDPHHRHQSHLFGLYPGNHITVDKTPQLAAACQRTLEIKGDKTTGWSTGWRVNLQARLHDGEAAYHTYRVLLNYISPDGYRGPGRRTGGGTYPNLLDAHSPFQIDGNFGGCAGVMEMLVQSSYVDDTHTKATLLPALPAAWAESGSIKGVCIRGGYKLDMAWKKGRIVSLTVHDCRPTDAPAARLALRGKGKRWNLKTRPGQVVRLL